MWFTWSSILANNIVWLANGKGCGWEGVEWYYNITVDGLQVFLALELDRLYLWDSTTA